MEQRREGRETQGLCPMADALVDVFVYGTLKRGQPNHKVLLDSAHGRAVFQGRGRTEEPYPLVIAGEHNIPRLLHLPGRGRRVLGEIYAVDERMLRFLSTSSRAAPTCTSACGRASRCSRGRPPRSRLLAGAGSASCTARPPTRPSGPSSPAMTATTRRGRTGSATTHGKTDDRPSNALWPGTDTQSPEDGAVPAAWSARTEGKA